MQTQEAQQALAGLRASMERLGDEELRVTRLTGASGDAQVRVGLPRSSFP